MLKIHLCGPPHPHRPLYLHEALSLMAILRPYGTFHYHMGPFRSGVVCAGSGP